MPNVTVVIPVAGYHSEIAARAIASVEAQTVPCEIVVVPDTNAKGAGWARNRGLESVNTDYVVFLDADDVISPQFAELSLKIAAIIERDDRYIYTNWIDGERTRVAAAPHEMWQRIAFSVKPDGVPDAELETERGVWYYRTWHPITTLIPTKSARLIGGFDEKMEGLEDKDFYVRLTLSGTCGVHLNAALFEYMAGGQRSINARLSGKEVAINQYILDRYKEYPIMGCCGDYNLPTAPGNDPQPGWVLVQALWAGNRQEWGRVTGILYPRSGNLKTLYIDPRDAEAMPDKYRVVQSGQAQNGVVLQPQYQPRNDWQHVANAVFGGAQPNAGQPSTGSPIEYKPLANQNSRNDILSKVKGAK